MFKIKTDCPQLTNYPLTRLKWLTVNLSIPIEMKFS